MKIERKTISNVFDCCKFQYLFKLENAIIYFQQLPSQDLILTVVSESEHEDKIVMEINNVELTTETKTEYLLYNSIDKLYNEIVENRCMYKHDIKAKEEGKDELFYTPFGYFELVHDKVINWKSDAPIVDFSSKSEKFLYNYLKIIRNNNKYIMEFINNTPEKRYSIEFNTSRSRYGRFISPFWQLFKDLEKITEPEYQMTIEDINNKKLIKRR